MNACILPNFHRQAISLEYTLILTTHSAFLYATAVLLLLITPTTSAMDRRIHTLTISQCNHPDIHFVGVYAYANANAHKHTTCAPHPPVQTLLIHLTATIPTSAPLGQPFTYFLGDLQDTL